MESKEWESTRCRQEMKKLHLKGGTHKWEREAMEDKGFNRKMAQSIQWRERGKEKKEDKGIKISKGLSKMDARRKAKIP